MAVEVHYCASPGGKGARFVDFDDVVRAHWQHIFRFVLVSVRDRHMAEDLTQDCFSKAYRGWPRFRGESTVSTWLRRIAANVINDFARDKSAQFWRRIPSVDASAAGEWLAAGEPSAERNVVMKDRLRAIWHAARLFPPKQQMAFALRFSEDMEIHEIATVMGITEGAAKVHLFRAVQRVRKTLTRRIGV